MVDPTVPQTRGRMMVAAPATPEKEAMDAYRGAVSFAGP